MLMGSAMDFVSSDWIKKVLYLGQKNWIFMGL
jgi:hypothetical protein